MTNKTIGMVTCPLCNEFAAVRKNHKGKFYYISAAGCITPNDDFGQIWFAENANIWGEEGMPPDGTPDWIIGGRSHPPNTRSEVRTQPAAQPEPEQSSHQDDDEADAGGGDPPPDPPPADDDDDDDDDSVFGFF